MNTGNELQSHLDYRLPTATGIRHPRVQGLALFIIPCMAGVATFVTLPRFEQFQKEFPTGKERENGMTIMPRTIIEVHTLIIFLAIVRWNILYIPFLCPN